MRSRRRRAILVLASVAGLAVGAWGLWQWSFMCALPPEVRARAPWHFQIPGDGPPQLQLALEALYSPEPAARYEAADTLADLGREAKPALPWLLAMLAEPHVPGRFDLFREEPEESPPGLWEQICQWLGRFHAGPEASDEDGFAVTLEPAGGAARAIIEVGEAAVPPLLAALEDANPPVRALAADALGMIADVRAVEPLGEALANDEPLVRAAAVQALGGIPCDEAVAALAAAARDPEQYDEIRRDAAEQIAEWGERGLVLLQILREGDPLARACAARALASWPDLEDEQVLSALTDALKDADARVVAMAANSLGWPGNAQAVPHMIRALRHPDAAARQRVARALGIIGKPDGVEPLIAALEDEDLFVRCEAAKALGRLKDPRAVGPLCRLVAKPDHDAILSAINALGEIGDAKATNALVGAFDYDAPADCGGYPDADEHHEKKVREAAAVALIRIGDPSAIPALFEPCSRIGYLPDNAKQLATMGLGVVPHAIARLDSEDPKIRRLAMCVLGQLPAPEALEQLTKIVRCARDEPQCEAAIAIGKTGDPRAFDILMGVVYDPEPVGEWLRMYAIEGLARLGDARAADPLLESLKIPVREPPAPLWQQSLKERFEGGAAPAPEQPPDPDRRYGNDPMFRAYVARALRLFGDTRAVAMYLELLDDFGSWPHDVYDPPKDLPTMGKPAVAPLAEALYDERGFVRTMAARALAKMGEPSAYKALRKALPDLSEDDRETVGCEFLNVCHVDGKDVRCDAAVDLFMDMLQISGCRYARRHAAEALRLCGDRRAVPLMRRVAEEDPCLTVRRIARLEAEALAKGDPRDDHQAWRHYDDPFGWPWPSNKPLPKECKDPFGFPWF